MATYPFSGGREKYPTMNGIHLTMTKEPVRHMVSSTVGIPVDSPDGYDELAPRFDAIPGARAIIRTSIDRISSSCGYSIPFMAYEDERPTLQQWAGRKDDAVTAITNAYKTDSSGLRIVEAYARILARSGKNDEALAALQNFAQKDQPVIKALIAQIKAGGKSPFDFAVVDEAQDVGVAELRLLAVLGAGRPDGLFFADDLGQRIFQQPFSWR